MSILEQKLAIVDDLEAWRKWGADIDWGRMKLSGSVIYEVILLILT
jgi:hypothetical protein